MNRSDRDTTRIVRSWLEEGADRIPDRVLDAVERQLHATHQRRAGWLARILPTLNSTTIRYGIAAVVVVIAALVGVRYLSPHVGGPTPTATPTVAPTTASIQTPLGTRQSLEPGRYSVPGFSAGVTVAVPSDEWSSSNNWVVIGPRGNEEPDGMAIRFFTASRIFENPTASADGVLEVGPSVDDMVQAILDHPAWEASGPTDIAIDGYAGQMVELSIPVDAELTDGDRFLLFSDRDSLVWGWAPGQTFELYIVDVEGERLIIDAFHYPDTHEEDLAAQRAVVESIQFDPRL